jgi:hypothetical protein
MQVGVKYWKIPIFATLSVSLTLADDIKTNSGKVFKNATVSRVEPDGILIRFSGGIVKVPFADLPEQVRKQYLYDSQKASTYASEQAAIVQQTNQMIEESNMQRREAKQDGRRSSSTAEENDEALHKYLMS